ncbi:unnamed protein product [Closterium sp. Naga37s-1]|nr:unnamed protein product [Closterium sp. Naga37s-1]
MPHSPEAINSPPVSQPSSPLGMQPWSREVGCEAVSRKERLEENHSQLMMATLSFPSLTPTAGGRGAAPPRAALRHEAVGPPPPSQTASVSATAAAFIAEFPVSHEAFPVAAASNAARRRALKRPRDECPTLGATQQPLLGGRESWLVRGGVVRGGVVRGGVVRGGVVREGVVREGVVREGVVREGVVREGVVPGGIVRGGVACSTERRHQSVAEQFEQQGESSRVQQQAADEALLEALLQQEHRQQQPGGARSRAQRVFWPRVGSESALPGDVLLGFSSDEPAFKQRAALSAPPPTQPHAPLPAPMPSQLAALPSCASFFGDSTPCCGNFALCIRDFAVHREEWLRIASESALPDDVLLGLCCEVPASTQRAALSAPAPAQPFTAPMPSPLAGLPGPTPGCTSRCLTAMLAGSTCGTQEQEYLDACINMLGNINNTDKHSDKDNGALFLDTPVAHVLLGGSALTVPLTSGPQAERPAAPGSAGTAPRAAGTALPEWAEEQGGTLEGGAEWHRQQQYLAQEGMSGP